MIVMDYTARTRYRGTYADLSRLKEYFELVIVVILEDERRWASLMHQVEFVLVGYRNHLSYQSRRLVSPSNRT